MKEWQAQQDKRAQEFSSRKPQGRKPSNFKCNSNQDMMNPKDNNNYLSSLASLFFLSLVHLHEWEVCQNERSALSIYAH